MDTNVLVRVICLAIASWGFNIASAAPNPPASSQEQDRYRKEHGKSDVVPISVHATVTVLRTVFHSWTVAEALAFAAREFSLPSLVARSQLGGPGVVNWLQSISQVHLRMTPITTLGFGLVCAGVLIRVICYRRLAKHFRFELSLQEDHKLITDGPYAFVRHPSYTGAFLAGIGAIILHVGSGSLWYEQGRVGVWKWLAPAYAAIMAAFTLPLIPRAKIEDEVLRAHFKDEWTRWAQRTPYRVIPGLY